MPIQASKAPEPVVVWPRILMCLHPGCEVNESPERLTLDDPIFCPANPTHWVALYQFPGIHKGRRKR